MVLLKQYAQNVNVCNVKINLNAGFCVGPFPKNCTCNDFTNDCPNDLADNNCMGNLKKRNVEKSFYKIGQ